MGGASEGLSRTLNYPPPQWKRVRSGWEGERMEQTQEEEVAPSQGRRCRAQAFQRGSHTWPPAGGGRAVGQGRHILPE